MGEDAVTRARRQAQERAARLLEALRAAGEDGLTPAEAGAATGLPERAARRAVERLAAAGQALRGDGRWKAVAAPAEGTGNAEPAMRPDVDRAAAVLPAEPLRSAFLLLLAAVAGRYVLRRRHRTGFPCALAGGATKTAKTALARGVCRVFGMDDAQCIRMVGFEAERTLFGRRTRRHGATTFVRWPGLDSPFLCLDECDKADGAVRRQALLLLDGSAEVEEEGVRVRLEPFCYATFNTQAAGFGDVPWLHMAYLRRAVVALDTWALRGEKAKVAGAVRVFLRDRTLPRIPLHALRAPVADLDDATFGLVEELLQRHLTPEGAELADATYVGRAVVGWAALSGCTLRRAALCTLYHVLSCRATLGHTRAGWQDAMRALLAGAPADTAPPAAAAEPEPAAEAQAPADPRWADLLAAWAAGWRDGAPGVRAPGVAEVARRARLLVRLPAAAAEARLYTADDVSAAYAAGAGAGAQGAAERAAAAERAREQASWRAAADESLRRLQADVRGAVGWRR